METADVSLHPLLDSVHKTMKKESLDPIDGGNILNTVEAVIYEEKDLKSLDLRVKNAAIAAGVGLVGEKREYVGHDVNSFDFIFSEMARKGDLSKEDYENFKDVTGLDNFHARVMVCNNYLNFDQRNRNRDGKSDLNLAVKNADVLVKVSTGWNSSLDVIGSVASKIMMQLANSGINAVVVLQDPPGMYMSSVENPEKFVQNPKNSSLEYYLETSDLALGMLGLNSKNYGDKPEFHIGHSRGAAALMFDNLSKKNWAQLLLDPVFNQHGFNPIKANLLLVKGPLALNWLKVDKWPEKLSNFLDTLAIKGITQDFVGKGYPELFKLYWEVFKRTDKKVLAAFLYTLYKTKAPDLKGVNPEKFKIFSSKKSQFNDLYGISKALRKALGDKYEEVVRWVMGDHSAYYYENDSLSPHSNKKINQEIVDQSLMMISKITGKPLKQI